MALDLDDLGDAVHAFLEERHLASLTTVREDGSPHVVPVGFTFDRDARVARVITWSSSVKVRNAEAMARAGGRAVVCQIDGGRWLSLEGPVQVSDDPDVVAAAVAAYTERYRPPKQRDDRVVLSIAVDRLLGRA